jgi:hypothetical protein
MVSPYQLVYGRVWFSVLWRACLCDYGRSHSWGASIGYGSTAAIGFGVEGKLQIMV